MSKPHKHAELKAAFEYGVPIQSQVKKIDTWTDWKDDPDPKWSEEDWIDYRIKPKEKQKVKMWQWVVYNELVEIYTLDDLFYVDRAAVEENYSGLDYKIIQRADWTEIEVEVEQDD